MNDPKLQSKSTMHIWPIKEKTERCKEDVSVAGTSILEVLKVFLNNSNTYWSEVTETDTFSLHRYIVCNIVSKINHYWNIIR